LLVFYVAPAMIFTAQMYYKGSVWLEKGTITYTILMLSRYSKGVHTS